MLIVMSTQATHTLAFKLRTHKWRWTPALEEGDHEKKPAPPIRACILCAAATILRARVHLELIYISLCAKRNARSGPPCRPASSCELAVLIWFTASARPRRDSSHTFVGRSGRRHNAKAHTEQSNIYPSERDEYNMYIIKKYAVYAK